MLRSVFITLLICSVFTGCSQNEKKPAALKKKETTQFLYQCGVNAPAPGDYVNDYLHIFTGKQVSELDSIMHAHETATTNQITILTADSAMLGNCNVKDYGLSIGNAWGVGQKNKNNGVVIILAPGLRQVGISNGYGIETKLSDEATQQIIDEQMIPEFKNNNYFAGLRKGLLSIIEKIK